MILFVVTNNYYLFYGLECSLAGKINYRLQYVDPNENKKNSLIKDAGESDIVLLISEGANYTFNFLEQLCRSRVKVIYSQKLTNFPFNQIFNFIVISARFYLSDLLLAINIEQNKSHKITFPKITEMEKIILYHSARGASVSMIANYLSVSVGTVYQHQLNAFSKVGIRKACQLPELPKNFIDYLYLRH
ncbi:hypothetical protein [Enterobacter cloacae]|uniref:hypothetical protein n=1 Tax=Enterobacter cloacae TaxID=550 RepID=UPI0030C0E353